MKKIVLLLFTLFCFAMVSWGQKDTIRPGEGPYDWPYLPETLSTLIYSPIYPIVITNEVPQMVCYEPDNPEQVIYGIGVVASPSSMHATWGVKLYSSMLDSINGVRDTLQCEMQIPYTSVTPYSYFYVTAWDAEHQMMQDTTVYIYNFYFEDVPYYVFNYEKTYLAYYDSLYDVADAVHPIVYRMRTDSSTERMVYTQRYVGREERCHRSCDSLPYPIYVSAPRFNEFIGILPITSPPPPRDTVPVCDAGIENLRLVRQGEQYGRQTAVVAWDAVGSSTYTQVRWGRYAVDSLTSEVTLQDGYVGSAYGADTLLIRGLDTGWYACRVRAVCEHECYYHDVTDYSDWSDTLYFYMAPPAPDTTAIAQAAQTLQVRIAPNPVQGTLTVSTEQEDSYTIEVYNDMGVRLQTERFTGKQHRLDVSRLPKGHYLLAVATKQATTRLAFVKQ